MLFGAEKSPVEFWEESSSRTRGLILSPEGGNKREPAQWASRIEAAGSWRKQLGYPNFGSKNGTYTRQTLNLVIYLCTWNLVVVKFDGKIRVKINKSSGHVYSGTYIANS